MQEKENSAFRLYRFVQKMLPQPQNSLTAQVLLSAFGVKNVQDVWSQNEMIMEVSALLSGEVQSLIRESGRLSFSNESRLPIVGAFGKLSIPGLATQWQNNYPAFLSALPLLLLLGEALPDEGTAISNDDLTGLLNEVESLRQGVEESSLPEDAKRFVYEQLDIIARAFRDYPINGRKAFKTAVREVVFHQAEHREVVEQLEGTDQMNRLKRVWQKLVEMSKYAIEFSKLLAAADSISEHGEKAIHAGAQVAHQVGGVIHNWK